MQNSFPRIWIALIVATVVSFASMGLSTYSVTRSIQVTPAITYTPISLGQKFNWTVAEVVDIQGNLYTYLGYEIPWKYGTGWLSATLRLARWQNGWMELSYPFETFSWDYRTFSPLNVTLSPYKLEIYSFNRNYLTAKFLES